MRRNAAALPCLQSLRLIFDHGDRGRRDRSDARDRREAAAGVAGLMPSEDAALQPGDRLVEARQLMRHGLKRRDRCRRKLIVALPDRRRLCSDADGSARRDDPVLAEMALAAR